ncbi:hypothetical protein ACFLQI_02990 [Candidatus Undinarchaeota archaeon]
MAKKKTVEMIHGMPAYVYVLLPFLLVFAIAFFVVRSFWGTTVDPRMLLVFLVLLVTASRMLQFWQFGIQVYDLILFLVTLKYGIGMGLLFIFISLVGVLYSVFFIRKHMLIHTIEGPLLQTFDLSLYVVLVGVAAIFFREQMIANIVMWGMFFSTIQLVVDALLTRRLIGIDLARLSNGVIVGILINYNFFVAFGQRLYEMLP